MIRVFYLAYMRVGYVLNYGLYSPKRCNSKYVVYQERWQSVGPGDVRAIQLDVLVAGTAAYHTRPFNELLRAIVAWLHERSRILYCTVRP